MTKHFGMQETTASPLEFLGAWKETRQFQTSAEKHLQRLIILPVKLFKSFSCITWSDDSSTSQ